MRTDLPIDDAVVEERRGEVFANLGRAWTPRLRMDAGLRYELSNQTVRGDAVADRRLHYLKPSLAFDWRASPDWRLQMSVKRTVAQLNFEDFISTAELSSRTMETKKVPGLYAIGEGVDVTGWLGGYNFQWAWASGRAAGQAV